MTPQFFSEAYGHLIPTKVLNPTHISSSQGHILIPREQAAWGSYFFIVLVGFWNLIWLMHALRQFCARSEASFCSCVYVSKLNTTGDYSWMYNWTSYTIRFLEWHLAYFCFMLNSIILYPTKTISDRNLEIGRSYEFFLPVASSFESLIEIIGWMLADLCSKCHQVAFDAV